MTPEALIELLLADVAQFNAWREANPDAVLSLSGADLSGARLNRALLVGADLSGANLDDADLSQAALSGASLSGASLKRANLGGARFAYAELMNAKFMDTALGRASVRGADLSGADLRGAMAQDASFVECDLRGADLRGCNLEGAQLKRTALEDPADRPTPPPAPGDFDGLLTLLAQESPAVRDDVMRFALFVHLTGARDAGAEKRVAVLNALAQGFGFDQAKINSLLPQGQVQLESVRLSAPTSHWARRVVFGLLCAMAAASEDFPPIQLEALGLLGGQYGFGERALVRRMSEELGVEIGLV